MSDKDNAAQKAQRKADERMRYDYPILQQFHTKHALGALSAPSCLCCGHQTHPITRPIAVQHMELPAIVLCRTCKDAAAFTSPASPSQPMTPEHAQQAFGHVGGAPEVTDAMVDAYLHANEQYWRRTDALPVPPNKWRTGTPREATRESLRAALGVKACDCERAMVPAGERCTRCGGIGTYGVRGTVKPVTEA